MKGATLITYTINDPRTGDCEDFTRKAEAIKEAKKKDYTPVFIDLYDEDEHDIIGDIQIDNKNVVLIP